jgi:hypothetical protein
MLIEKVKELSIKIDETKRDAELENLTGSKFFEKLQSESKKIKTERRRK